MPYSYNGWYASTAIDTRELVVGGVEIVPGILNDDDVYTVLRYVAEQFDKRVESLVPGWCWGYNYRLTTNDSSLSCHASGTAMDLNAPLHPYGVEASRNFSPAQIAEIRQIVQEAGVIVWGGDYNGSPDAMHFEIHGTKAEVAVAADRIRNQLEDDMFSDSDRALLRETKAAAENAANQAKRAREGSYKRDKMLIEMARETADDVDTILAKVR